MVAQYPCAFVSVSYTHLDVYKRQAVVSSPELRDAHNAALPKITQFFTELGLNKALFNRYKTLSEHAQSLGDEARALLHHEVRDFRLSGVEFEGSARDRFAAIQELLADTPVSYTHLDVYKRQHQPRRQRRIVVRC